MYAGIQWRNVTKYIYSSTVFKFKVLVLYLNISISGYFILLLHYILWDILYFLLHYIFVITLVTSYFANIDYLYKI